jgi:hypothetical protein
VVGFQRFGDPCSLRLHPESCSVTSFATLDLCLQPSGPEFWRIFVVPSAAAENTLFQYGSKVILNNLLKENSNNDKE